MASKVGYRDRSLLLLLFGQLSPCMLIPNKEIQMNYAIDISDKEQLSEKVKKMQMLIPNVSIVRAKAELQIEIMKVILDSANLSNE